MEYNYENDPSLTGEIIGNTVLELLKRNNLNQDHCVGIATDGSSTMVSEVKEAVSVIKCCAVNATYCPCLSHALNLTLTKASKIQDVRNAVDPIKTVIAFFYSQPKVKFCTKAKIR